MLASCETEQEVENEVWMMKTNQSYNMKEIDLNSEMNDEFSVHSVISSPLLPYKSPTSKIKIVPS